MTRVPSLTQTQKQALRIAVFNSRPTHGWQVEDVLVSSDKTHRAWPKSDRPANVNTRVARALERHGFIVTDDEDSVGPHVAAVTERGVAWMKGHSLAFRTADGMVSPLTDLGNKRVPDTGGAK